MAFIYCYSFTINLIVYYLISTTESLRIALSWNKQEKLHSSFTLMLKNESFPLNYFLILLIQVQSSLWLKAAQNKPFRKVRACLWSLKTTPKSHRIQIQKDFMTSDLQTSLLQILLLGFTVLDAVFLINSHNLWIMAVVHWDHSSKYGCCISFSLTLEM